MLCTTPTCSTVKLSVDSTTPKPAIRIFGTSNHVAIDPCQLSCRSSVLWKAGVCAVELVTKLPIQRPVVIARQADLKTVELGVWASVWTLGPGVHRCTVELLRGTFGWPSSKKPWGGVCERRNPCFSDRTPWR